MTAYNGEPNYDKSLIIVTGFYKLILVNYHIITS
jgi:hypothetical protein